MDESADPAKDVTDDSDTESDPATRSRGRIGAYSVAALVYFGGALFLLTSIARISHASGALLAVLWLVPVFGVLWLVGTFDDRGGERRLRRWPYSRNEPGRDEHEPESSFHDRAA
jgi:hypothetical protein